MTIAAVSNGVVIDQNDINQYKSLLVDGTLTDQSLKVVYTGPSSGYLAAYVVNSGAAHLILAGTPTADANYADGGVVHNPSITDLSGASGIAIGWETIKPTVNLTYAPTFRTFNVDGAYTLGTTTTLLELIHAGRVATVTLKAANTQVVSHRLDFPSITLSGSGTLDATNSATLLIGSAPASGYSIRDASSGKWLLPSGGLQPASGTLTLVAGPTSGNTSTQAGYKLPIVLNGTTYYIQLYSA